MATSKQAPTADYIMSAIMDARLQLFRASALGRGNEALDIATVKTLMDIAEYAIELKAQLDTSRDCAAIWKCAAKTHRKFGAQMAERVENAEQDWHDEVTSRYDGH